ncbi:MAG: sigma-70 family RNA polymerase sigma factor [Rhodococcus sp.]|nr:sigma-70 family RNA polymerase sigma factor [Rhodococcus sp. (in: high G+C Gram-positive bacteria)]
MNEIEVESSLQRLAPRARSGDEHAIREMVRIAYPLVREYCERRIGTSLHPHSTGDDVAHDVCLALMTSIGGCQRRFLLPFVYGVAIHKMGDAKRRARRHSRSDHDPAVTDRDADDPESAALRTESHDEVRRQLAALPERDRQILHMRFVLEMSAERMATVLGTTPGAVRVAQHRALRNIENRANLEKRSPDVR